MSLIRCGWGSDISVKEIGFLPFTVSDAGVYVGVTYGVATKNIVTSGTVIVSRHNSFSGSSKTVDISTAIIKCAKGDRIGTEWTESSGGTSDYGYVYRLEV